MVGAPMGREFFEAGERVDPEIEAQHRKVALLLRRRRRGPLDVGARSA